MNNELQVSTVDFYGKDLTTIKEGEIEYVAMRPIVDGIGLEWKSQHRKLINNKEKFNCGHMTTVAADGKQREMLCIPLKKLNGYLFSINPEKVHERIKDKVILYQEECFKTLYDYFTKGFALNESQLLTDESKLSALSRELRKLRTEDVSLYKKVRDAIAATSVDYKYKTQKELSAFFSKIQDSFHFAVAEKVSAQIVYDNVDADKENLGMISYDGKTAFSQAILVGKNFLDEKAFRKLEILYEQLFLFVENKLLNEEKMTLDKWSYQLNSLLQANGYEPFGDYGPVYMRGKANEKAKREYKIYKQRKVAAKERKRIANTQNREAH